VKWVVALLLLNSGVALPAENTELAAPKAPNILSVFPLGGQNGTSLQTEILGTDLDGASAVLFGDPALEGAILRIEEAMPKQGEARRLPVETAEGDKPTHVQRAIVRFEIDRTAKIGSHSLRIVSPKGVSNALQFFVNSEAVIAESDNPHSSPPQAQLVKFPCVVSGRIASKGELDYYAFDARRVETLLLKVSSNKVGKEDKFDVAELALYAPSGSWFDAARPTRLAFSDNTRLTYRFSKPGRYLAQVGSFLGMGGPDLVYQLQIVAAEGPRNTEHYLIAHDAGSWQERSWQRPLDAGRLTKVLSRTVTGAAQQEYASSQSILQKSAGREGKIASPRGDQANSLVPMTLYTQRQTDEAAGKTLGVKLPALLEGTITHSGQADTYRFQAKAGERLAFEIETPEAGPAQFNPRLGIRNKQGDELCSNIYRYAGGAGAEYIKSLEPKTLFTFEREGEYTLEIRDITTRHGDSGFVYRVAIRPQVPHVGKVNLDKDYVNLVRGHSAALTVTTELEEGFSGGVAFSLQNLPPGVEAVPGTEAEPERIPLPDEGPKELYRAKTQKTTIMLLTSGGSPATKMPQRIRLIAQPVVKGNAGTPFLVGECLLMVIAPNEQVKAQPRQQDN